jgi:type VI secretion system protein ImpC
MPGRMDIGFNWGRAPDGDPRDEDAPFTILALAPFRGAGPAPGALDARPAHRVDIESFDNVFSRIAPKIPIGPLGDGGAELVLAPKSIDDLHPDALLRDVPSLKSLADLLAVAKDPATFPAAAKPATDPAAESDAAALSRLLGRAPTPPTPAESAVDRLVREAVRPHIVAGPDPRQAEVVAGLTAAVGAALRVALRKPEYQAAEARWRSLRRLVFGLAPDGPARVYVLDATPAEWGDTASLARAISRAAVKDDLQRFDVVVLEASFGMAAADMASLRAWGQLAETIGTPLVAAGLPSLAGASSVSDLDDPSRWTKAAGPAADAWTALRHLPEAAHLALALPRVLARAPYGKLTDPIDAVPFEEVADDPGDSGFVWSSAAWTCAELAAAAAGLDAAGRVEDVPFAIFESKGGRKIQGSTELLLPDRAAEALLDLGLIPVVAHASANAIHLPRIQSIADPAGGLS